MPHGVRSTLLSGGVLLIGPEVGGTPVVPLPVGSVQFVRGLSDRLDLRVRYDVVALIAHRVGLELRLAVARRGGWSFALGVEPSALFFALPYQGAFIGGDFSTELTAMVTRRWTAAALTLSVGPTVQWAMYGQGGGKMLIDSRPSFAYLDVGARLEWSRGPGATMMLGLDLCVPLGDDPLRFMGVLPRFTIGWSWSR